MGIPASRSASTRKILHLSSGTTCRSSRYPVHPGATTSVCPSAQSGRACTMCFPSCLPQNEMPNRAQRSSCASGDTGHQLLLLFSAVLRPESGNSVLRFPRQICEHIIHRSPIQQINSLRCHIRAVRCQDNVIARKQGVIGKCRLLLKHVNPSPFVTLSSV